MRFNTDFLDLATALNAAGVDYVVVGAWAMAAHGVPRFTGDLDVFYTDLAALRGLAGDSTR